MPTCCGFPTPAQRQCHLAAFVPVYRCGSVLDSHQVPFSEPFPREEERSTACNGECSISRLSNTIKILRLRGSGTTKPNQRCLTSSACHASLSVVIRSFKHAGLKRFYEKKDRRGIRPDLVNAVERILSVMDTASTPDALDLPGYRLHRLKGDRKDYWAVTVRANWRIIFRFVDGEAVDVELIDYH